MTLDLGLQDGTRDSGWMEFVGETREKTRQIHHAWRDHSVSHWVLSQAEVGQVGVGRLCPTHGVAQEEK